MIWPVPWNGLRLGLSLGLLPRAPHDPKQKMLSNGPFVCKVGRTTSEMASEFRSMRPRLCHEMFDTLHCAFGNSPGVRPSTRMADFEVMGRSIAGHVGYDADRFSGLLRSMLGGATPGAP